MIIMIEFLWYLSLSTSHICCIVLVNGLFSCVWMRQTPWRNHALPTQQKRSDDFNRKVWSGSLCLVKDFKGKKNERGKTTFSSNPSHRLPLTFSVYKHILSWTHLLIWTDNKFRLSSWQRSMMPLEPLLRRYDPFQPRIKRKREQLPEEGMPGKRSTMVTIQSMQLYFHCSHQQVSTSWTPLCSDQNSVCLAPNFSLLSWFVSHYFNFLCASLPMLS